TSVPADPDRPGRIGGLFRADRPVPAPEPGRGGDRPLPDRGGRSAEGGPADARRPAQGPRAPPGREGRLLLQLVDARAVRVPAALRTDPCRDGRLEPAPRAAPAPAGGRPAPGLLRHR